MTYQALQIQKDEAGYRCTLKTLDDSALPEGDVTVAVDCSTINYKDGLALTNKAPVVRKWPMVPGIDGAGTVLESNHPNWKKGDAFLLNGWGVGETHWGCLAQKARLKGDWLVALPSSLTTRQAMAIGTAGYTAMLCVMALQAQGVKPQDGPVLVTIEYRIDPARRDEFLEVMGETRAVRLGQGALSWELFQDTADPSRFVEMLVDESWTEHLRRFDRITAADNALRERRRQFQVGGEEPKVTRSVAQPVKR